MHVCIMQVAHPEQGEEGLDVPVASCSYTVDSADTPPSKRAAARESPVSASLYRRNIMRMGTL